MPFVSVRPGNANVALACRQRSDHSVIREYKVVKKLRVEMPDTIAGILKCPNPNCITNHEKMETRFDVESRKPVHVRCRYCERRILESEFILR